LQRVRREIEDDILKVCACRGIEFDDDDDKIK